MDDFGLNSNDLSDFFSAVSVGKQKRKIEVESTVGDAVDDFLFAIQEGKKEVKKKKESLVGTSFDDLFWSQISKKAPQKNNKKVIKKQIKADAVPEVEAITEEKNNITNIEPNFTEPPAAKNKDPLTPLSQDFLTIQEFNKHYKLFLSRIQQQLSTLGGGGETRLEFLDDVDRNSAKTDNYFLKYDANINKWVGDPADGVGITSIVSITGITTYYQSNDTDDYIGVSADVPVTIVLPQTPSYGKKLIIKDEGNKIDTYNITVQSGIGKSVENDSSVVMKINHQSFTYFYNGNNWYII